MLALIIFILGLLVGSFVNAAVYRLRHGEPLGHARSHCTACGKTLPWYDLIPLISFFALGGKCRFCSSLLSWQYPLVEFTTGALFLLVYFFYPTPLAPQGGFLGFSGNFRSDALTLLGLLKYLVTTALFVFIFVYDLRFSEIPDQAVILGGAVFLVANIASDVLMYCNLFSPHCSTVGGILGSLVFLGFFGLQYLVSRGQWIGFGDVKLGLVLGLLLGFELSIFTLLFAYMLGGVVAIMLLFARVRKWKDPIPFGTFLTAAAFIGMIYGMSIIDWYFGFVGFW